MAGPSEIFAPDLLAGQVAIVTGGGTNLGRTAAAELVACGAHVVIAGRRAEVLDEAAAIVDAALQRHGRLDLLVNNAGGQYFVPAEAITAKGWRAVQRLNVGGTTNMTLAAVERAFKPDGAGTIVNVTVSPHQGFPAMAHTGAARAAVEALTRQWAEQWPALAVVAAAIGRFDTESLRKYPEVVTRGAARSVPLQRLGRMEEFAWLIAMLATPLGSSLSGSVVTLDGACDNWHGAWPPPNLTEETGEVPTEERRGAG